MEGHGPVDSLLVLLLLTNFVLIGSSRLRLLINAVGAQGFLLAIITVLMNQGDPSAHPWILAGTILLVLGVLIPAMLHWAVQKAQVEREMSPYVGFSFSLMVGTVIVAAAFLLRFDSVSHYAWLLPYALAAMLFGLFLIVTRRKAVTQVIGYVALGNGIYLFGIGLAAQQPLLVELGVLLNTFVAVFVMGIGIFRINQEFDDIDVAKLNMLRDEQ